MAGSLAAIRTKVDTALRTLTGSGQPVAFVYDHYNTGIQGYPCVMHEPSDINSEVEDTANNLRSYSIDILVIQELKNIDRNVAIDRVVGIMDSILDMFDQDFTLTGTCRAGITPVPGSFGEADMEDGPVISCSVNLICKDLVDIT